jgi:uncharacterized membrane protein YczE
MILWIPVGQKAGLGTIANALIIPLFLDITTRVATTWSFPGGPFVESCAGLAVLGFGGALYITCGMGPGPRDGLMTGLSASP